MGLKIIGHRGAMGLAPENTIVGLKKGLEHQVDGLEFDLRVTKDGVVILHHEPVLQDASGAKLTIKHCDYQELKSHKSDLITFEEAMEAIGPGVLLFIEVKPNEPTDPIITLLKKYLARGWQTDNMFLLSFSPKILAELHAALPDIRKMVNESWSGVRATYRARRLGTRYIDLRCRWLWSGFIASVSRRGWKLYTYSLNDPIKAKRWAKHGLQGVITDYPDRFEK